MKNYLYRFSRNVLTPTLIVSLVLPQGLVMAQGKGMGKGVQGSQSIHGRTAGELPYGLERYEGKHGGDLPRGLQTQLEEKRDLPAGLEKGGKKVSETGTKATNQSNKKQGKKGKAGF